MSNPERKEESFHELRGKEAEEKQRAFADDLELRSRDDGSDDVDPKPERLAAIISTVGQREVGRLVTAANNHTEHDTAVDLSSPILNRIMGAAARMLGRSTPATAARTPVVPLLQSVVSALSRVNLLADTSSNLLPTSPAPSGARSTRRNLKAEMAAKFKAPLPSPKAPGGPDIIVS